MGFGHRIYRAYDPRATVLKRTAFELGAPKAEVAAALEEAALKVLREKSPDRPLKTNVEYYAAVVRDFAGFPADRRPRCSAVLALQVGRRTFSSRSAPVVCSGRRRGTSGRRRARCPRLATS